MDFLKEFDIDNVCSDFRRIIVKECSEEYFKKIFQTLEYEYLNFKIFPSKENVFNAFKHVDFNNVKHMDFLFQLMRNVKFQVR